jgi:cytochrome c-type biogenesis protein
MESAPNVTFLAAFIAGLISFVTPCVLPLVPVYLSILSGASFDELTGKKGAMSAEEQRAIQMRVVSNAITFIIGFSSIFIVAGIAAGTFGQALKSLQGGSGWLVTNLLLVVFGPLLFLMGLNFSGLYKPRFLNQEKRFQLSKGKLGLLSSGLIGAAFAFGWAPCIGPILALILGFAAESGSRGQGAALLATYSFGLAVPFFLSALSVNGLIAFSQKAKRQFHTIEISIGTVLIIFGVFLSMFGVRGFETMQNGLDLLRQKLPSLDSWVAGVEKGFLEEDGGETEKLAPMETEDGDQVVFDEDAEVDVGGEPIDVDDSEMESDPSDDVDGSSELIDE